MKSGVLQERWKEIAGISMLAIAIYLFISIISFRLEDIPFHTSKTSAPLHNWAGLVGAYISFFIYHTFGFSTFFIPVVIFLSGMIVLRRKRLRLGSFVLGNILIFFSASSLFSIFGISASRLGYLPGGIIGAIFSQKLSPYFGNIGSYIILLTFLFLGILLAANLSFPRAISILKRPWPKIDFTPLVEAIERLKERLKAGEKRTVQKRKKSRLEELRPEPKPVLITKAVSPAPVKEIRKKGKAKEEYSLPSLSILQDPPSEAAETDEVIMSKARQLEETLDHFGIEAKVVEIHQGPVITSFEVEPAVGVKVNRITSLENDIALGLKAKSIRIVAPIPGKSAIGIEVPNDNPRIVSLKEVLSHPDYIENPSKLKIALGKDILGEVVVADLGEMPHLLIAGTTGSGKTVCINALIASILFNATPRDVRFLMVDPKMVELVHYDGLPHLITPVVRDVKKLAPILKWIIHEMELRYELLAHTGVRNIDSYNQMDERDISIENLPQVINDDGKMPYLVIIIDELADIMVIAQNQVEDAITRLAQLSRAVGIHMVLATQRPSVDVITGVIKANFPCRISFQVSSKVDSRTVLDMNGAETLLGRGDMLYLPANLSKPVRLQGVLVKDEEIKSLVEFLSEDTEPEYYEDIFKSQDSSYHSGEEEPDELYEEAVRIVKESGRASVSYLQRRLRIGYTRAARLIDRMEEDGIVGPFQGSRARAIMPDEGSPEKLEDGRPGEKS